MDRRLTKRCLGLIRTLGISKPLEFSDFCSRLERRRGRGIRLVPITGSQVPCGMWIKAPTIDYVFYMRSASLLHQKHIILHEFGHMLFEHEGGPLAGADIAAFLMPDLSPDLVEKMLHRSGFKSDSIEEREAETFADVTALRFNRPSQATEAAQDTPREIREIALRIERALA